MSASWRLNDHFEFTLEGLNLTDEFQDQWVDSSATAPRSTTTPAGSTCWVCASSSDCDAPAIHRAGLAGCGGTGVRSSRPPARTVVDAVVGRLAARATLRLRTHRRRARRGAHAKPAPVSHPRRARPLAREAGRRKARHAHLLGDGRGRQLHSRYDAAAGMLRPDGDALGHLGLRQPDRARAGLPRARPDHRE